MTYLLCAGELNNSGVTGVSIYLFCFVFFIYFLNLSHFVIAILTMCLSDCYYEEIYTK